MPIPFIIGGLAAIGSAIGAAGAAAAGTAAAVGATAAATAATVGTAAAATAATVGAAAAAAAPVVGTIAAGTAVVGTGAVGLACLYEHGYDEGHSNGYRSGYESASDVYTKKFQKQVDMFERDLSRLRSDIDGYRTLCNQYEALLRDLQNKSDRTSEESSILSVAYMDYGRLKSLAA